ncbi:MAG: hypothetical protein ACFCUR_07500 [Rhodomicrobiaceae bacterium]
MNTENGPRSEEWIREREARRAEIHNKAVQGLFILNGGGSIALLSFLSQIWDKAEQLVYWVAAGISCMAFGLLLCGTFNFLRYESSRKHDKFDTRGTGVKLGCLMRIFSGASLVLFAVGACIVMWGVFHVQR